jgi:hypothetical protein
VSKFVMRDAYIAVNGTNLSDHCSSIDVKSTADDVDFTSFGPSGYKEYGVGFKDAVVTCTFFSDFAASSVHSVLQPLYDNSSTFGLEVRAKSDGRSSANPAGTMTARLYDYSPLTGKVGDAATFDVPFRNASTAGFTWAASTA